MRVIKEEQLDLDEVVAALKAGETLVYPTETSYGLGCDATNVEAVRKVFDIKQRQQEKSVLVVVPYANMIMDYVDWTPTLTELAEKYWPGPLTVVTHAKKAAKLPEGVIREDGTIAFRVTSHPFAAVVSEKLGAPLVSTSANISSQESPYDIVDVLAVFQDSMHQPDIVIDSGSLPHRSPSTVVKVVGESVEVLRQGEIVIEL